MKLLGSVTHTDATTALYGRQCAFNLMEHAAKNCAATWRVATVFRAPVLSAQLPHVVTTNLPLI